MHEYNFPFLKKNLKRSLQEPVQLQLPKLTSWYAIQNKNKVSRAGPLAKIVKISFETRSDVRSCNGYSYTNELNRAKDWFLALKPDDIDGPHHATWHIDLGPWNILLLFLLGWWWWFLVRVWVFFCLFLPIECGGENGSKLYSYEQTLQPKISFLKVHLWQIWYRISRFKICTEKGIGEGVYSRVQ